MVAHGGSWRSPTISVMPRPDSSVVERGPEKAGVGGSIPSLATIFSTTYKSVSLRFHSNSFQLARRDSPRIGARTDRLSSTLFGPALHDTLISISLMRLWRLIH